MPFKKKEAVESSENVEVAEPIVEVFEGEEIEAEQAKIEAQLNDPYKVYLQSIGALPKDAE